MNFDELFKYCEELNKSTAEKCLVCHIPVENQDKHIKLKCTHIFHPECVKYKDGSLKCLYCEKTSIPDKINWSQTILLKPGEVACKIVLKSGSKKGQYCNRINCKYHKLETTVKVINGGKNKITKPNKSKAPNTKTTVTQCTQIIKTGAKAGQFCLRPMPCLYHKVTTELDQSNNKSTKQTKQTKQTNTEKCKFIIKSGFDAGKECGRNKPCPYHKNKLNKTNIIPSIDDINVNDEEEELIEV